MRLAWAIVTATAQASLAGAFLTAAPPPPRAFDQRLHFSAQAATAAPLAPSHGDVRRRSRRRCVAPTAAAAGDGDNDRLRDDDGLTRSSLATAGLKAAAAALAAVAVASSGGSVLPTSAAGREPEVTSKCFIEVRGWYGRGPCLQAASSYGVVFSQAAGCWCCMVCSLE